MEETYRYNRKRQQGNPNGKGSFHTYQITAHGE